MLIPRSLCFFLTNILLFVFLLLLHLIIKLSWDRNIHVACLTCGATVLYGEEAPPLYVLLWPLHSAIQQEMRILRNIATYKYKNFFNSSS